MTTQTIDIPKLLPWSDPRRIETRNGPRDLRTADPTPQFWDLWRSNKQALKDAGLSCAPHTRPDGSRDDHRWVVQWWAHIDPVAAAREKAEREAASAASRATDAAIEIPKPDGLEYLGYQKAGIAFGMACFGRGKGVLIADEMGLGKTIQAIGLINADDTIRKVIVVCPNTLKLNWQREMRKWFTRKFSIGIQYSSDPWLGRACDVVIINYDIVHKFAEQIAAIDWDFRIIDEAHYAKNPKARRTKATLAIGAKRKASLTGTPIENRPVELWPVISDLDPIAWSPKKGFFRFAQRYCGAKHNGFGWDFGGHSNEAELQHKLRGTIMVRRLKCDVLTELPAKRRQVIELEDDRSASTKAAESTDFASRQNRIDALRARVEIAKASDSREEYEAAVAALRDGQGALFEEMARIRHDTGVAKVPQAVDFLRDALENGKIVCFGHHLDVIRALKAEFPQAAVVTGEVAAGSLRQAEVDRFQTDPKCDLFLGNNAAAEGLTLTASSHVVFVEGDWVPGKLAQKEDRCHRIGQKDSVLCTYLVLEGSVDAQLMKSCVEKLNVIDMVLDRQGGYDEDAEAAKQAADLIGRTFAGKGIGGLAEAINRTKIQIDLESPEVRADRSTFDQLAKEAVKFPAAAIPIVHHGMKVLAGVCDGAFKRDEVGFNGCDTKIGHSFAEQLFLTPKQAALGAKILRKYHRQLGPDFMASLDAALGKEAA